MGRPRAAHLRTVPTVMRGRLKRSVGSHPRFRQHWRASTPTSKSTHPNYGKLPGHTCPHEAACVRRLPHPEQIHRWNGRGKECGLRGRSLRPAVCTYFSPTQPGEPSANRSALRNLGLRCAVQPLPMPRCALAVDGMGLQGSPASSMRYVWPRCGVAAQ